MGPCQTDGSTSIPIVPDRLPTNRVRPTGFCGSFAPHKPLIRCVGLGEHPPLKKVAGQSNSDTDPLPPKTRVDTAGDLDLVALPARRGARVAKGGGL
jgi:hypothetical protein